MCFVLCCCCNLCNNSSSKTVEITIFILSIASLASSVIGLLFVNKEHISKIGYICLLIVISFSIILIISIILILIWRFKSTINKQRNCAGLAFSKIGLITSIFCLLFVGIWESISISNFYNLNNPCKSIKKSDDIEDYNKTNLILRLRRNIRYLLTYEENKEEFCLENPDYIVNVVSKLEYIYLFVSASTTEAFLFVLLYFWFNDFRRIKFLVDGKLIDTNIKNNKYNYENKAHKNNNNINYIIYKNIIFERHYNNFGKSIIFTKKDKNKNININNNKKPHKHKNLSNVKDYKNKNMIIYENSNNEKVDINNQNTIYKSDRINLYNMNFSKENKNINLNLSKSSNKESSI